MIDDVQLVQEVASGDAAAFRALYETYKDRVYNMALHQLAATEDAEEVTQDVFVEIHRSAQGFRGEAQVSTWIYRIVVTKCLDRLRSRNRRKRSFIARLFGGLEEHEQPPDCYHPGVAAEQRETTQAMLQAIRQLPEKQQTAFMLVYIEDLPQKEVAAIMNLGLKAVESLLQRAKTALRKILTEK